MSFELIKGIPPSKDKLLDQRTIHPKIILRTRDKKRTVIFHVPNPSTPCKNSLPIKRCLRTLHVWTIFTAKQLNDNLENESKNIVKINEMVFDEKT